MIRVKIISFTAQGAKTGEQVAQSLPDCCAERYARGVDASLKQTKLSRMVQQAMADCDLIVFVGAAGIAVRMCAPFLQGKQYDPAVLVIDEQAKFVISLLSGHLGGANTLAQQIAEGVGAQPVITTATDGRGAFAVDTWAKAHNCTVHEVARIKHISGAILSGQPVGFQSDFPVSGALPDGIGVRGESGIVISVRLTSIPFPNTLHLIPRIVTLGIGCRRGTEQEAIAQAASRILEEEQIPWSAIRAVASIDIKKDELGLCAFCQQHALPFVTYTAQELRETPGQYTASAFVQHTVGVDNVCERAAIRASENGQLLRAKTSCGGITIALAVHDWEVVF